MNIEKARFNMIEQQIRPWKVLDQQVLDLMSTLPREQFVPEAYKGLAFADIAIPLGSNRFMLHPAEEGRLLQAVKPKLTDKVLVVNVGSGYVTALLSAMSDTVDAFDSDQGFVALATDNLSTLNMNNVTVDFYDPTEGVNYKRSYDVIVVLGSMHLQSESLKRELNVGGRLFCIIGEEPTMEALLITRTSEKEWQEEGLFETSVPPLENAPEADSFHF
jgi:protein-L-isoaspartate(D-aspartate) O-methyltransferase